MTAPKRQNQPASHQLQVFQNFPIITDFTKRPTMASQSNGLRPTFHRSDFSRSRILFDDIRPTALPCRSSRNVRLATKARCFGNLQESFQLRNQGSRVFPDPLNNLIQLVNQFWSLFNQFWPRLMITLSMNCPQVHER